MASIAAVFQGCSDSLKSILASQDFGSEYELLCTELSIQWLRVRMWGESVGLDVEENDRPTNHIFNRRDIEKTVTQTIHSIAYILSEIEIIRRKYDLRPSSPKSSEDGKDKPKPLRAWKSFSSLFAASPNPTVLQQRMQENQKQKSFLAIAKWANSDAKKFEEKIKALKSLIDGLESISQAAGVAIRPATSSSSNLRALISEDNPPPYTPRPRTRRQATEGARPSPLPNLPETSSSPYSTALTHFTAFKSHLSTNPAREPRRQREKLTRLSEPQLDELVLDIYDELCRRQSPGQTEYLPDDASFNGKRNAARKKLGALPGERFSDLVGDVVAEMSRRFPTLTTPSESDSSPSRPRAFTAPSSQLPLPRPPPSSHSSLNVNITPPTPPSSSPSKPKSSSGNTNESGNLEITKSFRCSPHDQTYKVLPAALKKYGINDEWENYRLVIACGKEERVLGLEERPLGIFKELQKGGKEKPVFMLRKVGE